MRVEINHHPVDAPEDITLAQLLEREGLNRPGVAVAVDNSIVTRNRHESFKIAEGMKITVIRAVCGG